MKLLTKQALLGATLGIGFLALILWVLQDINKKKSLANLFTSQVVASDQILASLPTPARDLPANYTCFDGNSHFVKSWQDPNFIEKVKQLSPSLLRLPNAGNYWDWKRGGYVLDTGDLPAGLPVFLRQRERLEYTASKLEDFGAGLTATGTSPLWALNMLSSNLEYQLEMLRAAKKLGMPVKLIELGNEVYFPLPNERYLYPSSDDYAKATVEWITAIKKEFPDAKIAVVGAAAKPDEKSGRIKYWDQSIFKYAFPAADAMTLHFYPRSGLEQAATPATGKYPLFTEEDVPVILSMPFKNWQQTQTYSTLRNFPKDKEIWVTEYSLMDHGIDPSKHQQFPRLIGTWAHGIYVSAMSLLFLEDERIKFACNHALIGSHMFGAIQYFNKVPLNMSRREFVPVTPMSLTATGEAMTVVNSALKDMKTAQKIDFNGPVLSGKDNFQYPALYGWMLQNNTEKRAVLLNLSNKNLQVNMNSIFNKPVKINSVSSNPSTFVSGPNQVNQQTTIAQKVIELPAYSVNKLSDQLK